MSVSLRAGEIVMRTSSGRQAYSTSVAPPHSRPLLEALSRRVDGLIIFSRMLESEMDWVMDLGTPLVYFGRPARLNLPWVGSDDQRGAGMLVRHLVSLGHKRIAYLRFPRSRRDEDRLGAIRECLKGYGQELTVYEGSAPTSAEGERLCSVIMLGEETPTL